jgi:hypothetical protein
LHKKRHILRLHPIQLGHLLLAEVSACSQDIFLLSELTHASTETESAPVLHQQDYISGSGYTNSGKKRRSGKRDFPGVRESFTSPVSV